VAKVIWQRPHRLPPARCGRWRYQFISVFGCVYRKQDLDPFSRLCTVRPYNRQTDRLADRRSRYGIIDRSSPHVMHSVRPNNKARSFTTRQGNNSYQLRNLLRFTSLIFRIVTVALQKFTTARDWIVRETRCRRISWADLFDLLLHVVCLCSLSSKFQEISCNYLHEPPFCKFFENEVQRLIAQNRRISFKAERVYLKMVQRAIAVNQLKAAIWSSSTLNCDG